jgi:hypothetical protein
VYEIVVTQAGGDSATEPPRVMLDGVEQADNSVALADDGKEHRVEVSVRP